MTTKTQQDEPRPRCIQIETITLLDGSKIDAVLDVERVKLLCGDVQTLRAAAKRYVNARKAYDSLDAPGGRKFDELGFAMEQLEQALAATQRTDTP